MASLSVLLAGGHRHHLGSEHSHAVDVEFLPLTIQFAHVNDALQPEHGRDGGGGDAMLACAGFGNDAALAHAPGQQDLSEGVVDLVRARVEQVFSLEINLRPAQLTGEALRQVERRRPPAELPQVIRQLPLKFGVALRLDILLLQLLQRMHQCLGNKPAAIRAEPASGVGQITTGCLAHAPSLAHGASQGQPPFSWPGGRVEHEPDL